MAHSLGRIERICQAEHDSVGLRQAVLAEIRRVVGFDAFVWPLTDPESAVGSAPIAEVPSLAELPLTIRLKYLTRVNRWTSLGARPVAGLQSATNGHPERSLLWR